jgi:hypothetical protein
MMVKMMGENDGWKVNGDGDDDDDADWLVNRPTTT